MTGDGELKGVRAEVGELSARLCRRAGGCG